MTIVVDRDSGEQRRITEQVVELALWWLNGPDSQPPGSIARLPDEERHALWEQAAAIAAIASRRGGFIHALANCVAARHHGRRTTDVNESTGESVPAE